MQTEFWKNTQIYFLPKMGLAMPCPSVWPIIAENNSENVINHKLLDAEGNLKKYQTLIFAKNGCGPATPLRVIQHCWKKFGNFNDHKLLDGEGIFFKYQTLIFVKNECGSAKPLWVTQHRWKKIMTFLLIISFSMVKGFC